MFKILNKILMVIMKHPLFQSFFLILIYNIMISGLLSCSKEFESLIKMLSPLIVYGVMLWGIVRECAIVHTYNAHRYVKYMIYCVYVLNSLILIINIFNALNNIFNVI